MARPKRSEVERQVVRVRRRLFLQAFLDRMAWCWAAALGGTAVWLLIHPLLAGQPESWLRWTVLGGGLAAATLLAWLLAWWRAPSFVAAALALDEKFGLKERVTTSVGLTPEEAATSAGQALLVDVSQRVPRLKVREGFSLRLSWPAALVPLAGVLLTLVTLFYEPSFSFATSRDTEPSDKVVNAAEVQKQLDKLKKTPRAWPKDQRDAEKLKEIEAAWDKLVNKPLDPNNQEQVRQRVQDLRDLEDKMKERLDGLKAQASKTQSLKQHLAQLANDPAGKAGLKDGPAKEIQDALAKGNMAKAREEVERLMKKVKEEKLSPEQQKQLADELAKLEKQLQRLADLKDRKERLQRDRKDGKINQEQLEREMDRLAQEAKDLNMLNRLAMDLAGCEMCLRGGNSRGAADKLALILDELERMDLNERELLALIEAQGDLQDAQEGLCDCLDGDMNSLGKKASRRPGTLRPIAPDSDTSSVEARQRAEVDPRGKQRISGFTRGGTFNKVPAREVGGVFRQAVQEAPEAIERQRVPQDAAEMLRGYYENLGGQKKN
jgi:uncharacterized coiled-coil DUF342 family protein